MRWLENIELETHLDRYMPCNTSHQDDTSPIPEPLHLLASRLCGEERAVDVDVEGLRCADDNINAPGLSSDVYIC